MTVAQAPGGRRRAYAAPMGPRRRRARRRGRLVVASVLVGVTGAGIAGCGADVERTEAARAADAFTGSLAGNPAAACALLAPRALDDVAEDGSCASSLEAAGLPAVGERLEVTVAGHSAQVRYTGDTLFLARFGDGWRVTAAGCEQVSSDPAVPYDCAVDGG